MSEPERPKSSAHSLFIGAYIGAMWGKGIHARPVMIGEDYSDTLVLAMTGEVPPLTVKVPEPPDDWAEAFFVSHAGADPR